MNLKYEITHEKSKMHSLVNQISHVVVEAVVAGGGGTTYSAKLYDVTIGLHR